jgi:exopolysaccharide biosynthesis polyprenyl glycosylphosphotransferase
MMLLTFYLRYFGDINSVNLDAYLQIFVPIIAIITITSYFNNLYHWDRSLSHLDILYRSARSVTFSYFIVVTFIFYSRAFAFPRTVLLISWLLNMTATASWRMALKALQSSKGEFTKTLIIGISEETRQIGLDIERYSPSNYSIEEYLQVNKEKYSFDEFLDNLEKRVVASNIQLIVVSTQELDRSEITSLYFRLNQYGTRIAVHPNLYEILVGNIELKQIAGVPLLEIRYGDRLLWYRLVKQTLEYIAALFGLILLSPLFLLIIIAIKLDSKGPVFYFQERLGFKRHPYRIVKFRTMRVDAEEEVGPTLAREGDPRVTRLGRFLRQSHLDELPQLVNVVFGQMALIGPRPERAYFAEQYEKTIPAYQMRYMVKPGITGLGQVHGRYDTTIENKLRYDLVYINNMSPLLDLKILVLTIRSILTWKDKI